MSLFTGASAASSSQWQDVRQGSQEQYQRHQLELKKLFILPYGTDAHNIFKWIILSTFTRGVRNMFLLSLIYSIYLSLFPSIT